MNELIEELKLKAIDFADATYKYDLSEGFKIQEWDAIRLNEFAKLLIDECIGCCEQVISDPVTESVDTWLNGGSQCIDEIKHHFGIK